jgi:hypothetical protein
MTHYDMVLSATTLSRLRQKRTLTQYAKQFCSIVGQIRCKLDPWCYALGISLFPFIFVFCLFTGPQNNFGFLWLFNDNGLIYVCVSMSALSLYTYGKINWVAALHGFVMLSGMAIYFSLVNGVSIPLFEIYDRRAFIALFLLFSVVLGIVTLIYSFIKKGEKL